MKINKLICLVTMLFSILFVNAYELPITMTINITTNQTVTIIPYDNATNSYINVGNGSLQFSFSRNVTDCSNASSTLTVNVSDLMTVCRENMAQLINSSLLIQESYKDFSTYFDKYSSCNAQLASCNATANTYGSCQASLTQCEQNKATISSDRDSCHWKYDNPENNINCKTQVINLESELASERGRKWLWIIIGLIIPSIIVVIQNKDRFRRSKRDYAIPPPMISPR